MSFVTRGKYTLNGQGNVASYEKVETLKDAEDLSSAMGASGVYPAGLSKCFAAGINGDSPEVCAIYLIDKSECECTDMHEEFEAILASHKSGKEKLS